jgi:hypothetical protein
VRSFLLYHSIAEGQRVREGKRKHRILVLTESSMEPLHTDTQSFSFPRGRGGQGRLHFWLTWLRHKQLWGEQTDRLQGLVSLLLGRAPFLSGWFLLSCLWWLLQATVDRGCTLVAMP